MDLTLEEADGTSSKGAVSMCFPTSQEHGASSYSVSSPTPAITKSIIIGHYKECLVVSHYGVDLHFANINN